MVDKRTHPPRSSVAGITLLHPIVKVRLPGTDKPLPDLQSRARVLRLFALAQGHYFSTEELNKIFPEIGKQSIAPMIRDLRRRLGGPKWGASAIHTLPGSGYGLKPELAQVDALTFKAMLSDLPALGHQREIRNPEDLELGEAEAAMTVLENALELWRGNPARGLEDITYEEHRYDTEYERLQLDARRVRTFCALRIGTMSRLREAILELVKRVQPGQEPDLEQWCLLLRAYYSTGNHEKVVQTYNDANKYYRLTLKRSLPKPIKDCYERAQSGDESFSLFQDAPRVQIGGRYIAGPEHAPAGFNADTTVTQLHSLIQDLRPAVAPDVPPMVDLLSEMISIMTTIGVSTASVLRLQGSRVEPKQCLKRVTSQLWFSGVLASKWVETAAIRSEFDDLLTVLDHREGSDVRMLIMNPAGPGYKRLYDMRNGRLSAEHVPHLARLAKMHPSLQVKVFDHLPTFRILVIDQDFVTFSFYRLDEVRYIESDGGLEAPHVVLDPLAPWPLAEAFTGLFEESWETAENLNLERYQ